jgi:hypothetical protein
VDVFGEAITPSKEFYERRMSESEVNTLLGELKGMIPTDSPRGLLAQGTQDALYKAAAANPKWAEPHFRLAATLSSGQARIAPLKKATELEPRNVSYWEALARAQVEAGQYPEASKSWISAERAAGTEAERAKIRAERAAIEEKRVEAELAAARAAKDEAERELRRVMAESEARVKAAESRANRTNAAQATFTEGRAPVSFQEGFGGTRVTGRLMNVECVEATLKLDIQLANSSITTVLIEKNPEKDGQPVFACGAVNPPRRIEVVHDGKADIRWNTVGVVQTYELP